MTDVVPLWTTRRPTQTIRGLAERPRMPGSDETTDSVPGGMTTMSPLSPSNRRAPFRVEGDTAMIDRSR